MAERVHSSQLGLFKEEFCLTSYLHLTLRWRLAYRISLLPPADLEGTLIVLLQQADLGIYLRISRSLLLRPRLLDAMQVGALVQTRCDQ